jgi:hypothetical protein
MNLFASYSDALGLILFFLLLVMVCVWAYYTNISMTELELENKYLRKQLQEAEAAAAQRIFHRTLD